MRLLWLLSLRLAATRADACAAATAQIQGQTCNATLTLDCSEKYLSIIKCGGITYLFSRKELIIPVNGELVRKHEQRARVRQRLSGRCRADRDEACENCYSPHSSTLCPFSLTARAAAVESGVELVLAPTNGEALRWVLPRHARPPWRLPQHAPL